MLPVVRSSTIIFIGEPSSCSRLHLDAFFSPILLTLSLVSRGKQIFSVAFLLIVGPPEPASPKKEEIWCSQGPNKGLFTHYVITEGEGCFQMITFDYVGVLADDYAIKNTPDFRQFSAKLVVIFKIFLEFE